MKVTLIQMDIAWGDIAANCCTASESIDAAPGSDLYVLPEMWSTGFASQPEDIADRELLSLSWMQQKADSIDAAIAGSVATRLQDGSYRNRFYFVRPGCETVYYDKRHLFTYGGEHHRYTAGRERTIVEWRGVRFLLQVCYDLRFPTFARNKGCAYDAILYVASWPTSRIEAWHILLRARAIENQCYVMGVDRIGSDPACTYCGGTEAIDVYGRLMEACPDNTPCSVTIEVDMDRLMAFRQKFPVLDDAD